MDKSFDIQEKPIPSHVLYHLTTLPTSGKTIAAYCKESGITAWSFYSWRKRYGKQQQSSHLQPTPPSILQSVSFTALGPLGSQYRQPLFDIHFSAGTRISVYSGTTAQELAPFLGLLSCRGAPC
jgi:hypothetical protein